MRTVYFSLFVFFIGLASSSFADETSRNATKPFPRLNPTTAAEDMLYDNDNLDAFGNPSSEPIDILVEKYTSNEDLKPLIARMFSVADGYVGTVNKRIDEAQVAATSCDRAQYDASIERLIVAYVKASLYLQRKMESIDALTQASGEYEQNSPIEQGKRRWSLFWAAVHDTLGNVEITPSIIEIMNKNANSSRYYILGQAYSQAYGDMLKRMENILKTADYPQFEDCDEPIIGPTLKEADAALAEALAAQKAMDEVEADLAEQDRQFAKLKEEMDKITGDAELPDASEVDYDGTVVGPGIGADPQMNPDGSFMTPDFSGFGMEDVYVDVPEMPEIPNFPEIPKNSPLAIYQSNPCGQSPRKVCNVLNKEFRTDCARELAAFNAVCKKGPTIISVCQDRCVANWQQGVHELALADLAQKHIRSIYGTSEQLKDSDYEAKEAEIRKNNNRIGQIERDAKKRVIHIYINTNTDMVIRHAGNKFVPNPPLRYAGTLGGGLYQHERNAIESLKAQNSQLRQEIDDLVDGVHGNNSWVTSALSKWTSDADKSDGHCPSNQNDSNRDACVAACDGNVPVPVQNVCYSSFVPQLALPFGRAYLYPPGHPKRIP